MPLRLTGESPVMHWLYNTKYQRLLTNLLFSLSLCLATSVLASTPKIEVYETYNPASSLIPHIKPLLSGTDHITSFRGKLILKASPHTHQAVIELLEVIDTPPKTLLITIRERSNLENSKHENMTTAYYNKRIDGSFIAINGKASAHKITTQQPIIQSLRIIEGEEGYIVSENDEKDTRFKFVNGFFVATDEIKRSGSGFYIRPTLRKDQVQLSISHESFKRPNKKTQKTNQTHTDVLVPFNTWTQLSSSTINETTMGSNTYSSHNKQDQNLEVKVEILK